MRQHQSAAVQFGASESTFDLGGLPITRLVIKKGAGKVDFDFSAPNPQLMGLLKLEVGAVGLKMFMSPIVPLPRRCLYGSKPWVKLEVDRARPTACKYRANNIR